MRIKEHAIESCDMATGHFANKSTTDIVLSLEFYKKGGATVTTAPAVTPTPPVEDTSVELDEEGKKKKVSKQGKSTLKVPLATSSSTGLKV